MSDTSGSTPPPPGWYPEQAGSSGMRWWDGRAWTEHRSAPAGAAAIVQPALPPGTTTSTPWIWLLSLLPLVSLGAAQPGILAFGPLIQEQLRFQRELVANPDTVPTFPTGLGGFTTLLPLTWGISLVLLALAVLVAWLDWRALKRRGVVQPFPWGWGFLPGVYIVGRAVVAHRRVGAGYAPLILAIVLFVAAIVVQLVEFAVLIASAASIAG